MKFVPDTLPGTNLITRYAAGELWVGRTRFAHSLIVPWEGPVRRWSERDASALDASDFDAVLALQPEVVIFGSGATLRFVAPALLRGLIERRIGVETMDTGAACRTFNVLATEGRAVVAALLLRAAAG